MTDKELRKLRRADLLEMLIEAGKKIEGLEEENRRLQEAQTSRELLISSAGSIAEAALQLNGIFESAQKSADLYLENVRRISADQEQAAKQAAEQAEEHADVQQEVSDT